MKVNRTIYGFYGISSYLWCSALFTNQLGISAIAYSRLLGVFVLFNLPTGGELIINPIASGLYFYLGFSLYNNRTLLFFMRSHWKSYLWAGSAIFAGHQGVYSQIDPFLPPHDPIWTIWGLPLVLLKVGAAVLLSFSLIGFASW